MDPLVTDQTHGAIECARAFIDAIVWGAHTVVWELLSAEGRETVLAVAASRGLDRVTATRLRDGQCSSADQESFLRELTQGLRRDLRSVDLARVSLSDDARMLDDGTVAIDLLSPSQIPGTGAWAAGRIILGCGPDQVWRVDLLEPRVVP